MLRSKEFKKKGRGAFYRNWKYCIIVCFIYAIFVGAQIFNLNQEFNYNYRENLKVLNLKNIKSETNSDIVNEFINGLKLNNSNPQSFWFSNATRGVLGTISNNVSKTGSFLFGLLNAFNQVFFKDKIGASIIIIIGAFLSLIYWIFVSKVLEVGLARFFLENHKYTKTKPTKLLFIYRLNKTWNTVYIMLVKNIKQILWSLTIVGGIVKYYSYMLVPYIVAENPNIKCKDALKLSQDLMNGYKWAMFKLDMTFIPYYLLGFLTFNISNLVFTTPLINSTKAEVYLYLRDLGKTKGIENAFVLADHNLEGEVEFSEYPLYDYMLSANKTSKWLNFNYKRHYKLTDIILIFFIVAIIGFLWETILHLFQTGEFVKRGTLYGPWLPIYGFGAIAVLIFLEKKRSNPFTYFLLTMVVCGIIEYFTSLYLEVTYHTAWWSYEGYFLNINGRVCLEGLLLFGIGGTVITYILAPNIANILDRVNKKVKIVLSIILVSLISVDFYISGVKPNQGEGISHEVQSRINHVDS